MNMVFVNLKVYRLTAVVSFLLIFEFFLNNGDCIRNTSKYTNILTSTMCIFPTCSMMNSCSLDCGNAMTGNGSDSNKRIGEPSRMQCTKSVRTH